MILHVSKVAVILNDNSRFKVPFDSYEKVHKKTLKQHIGIIKRYFRIKHKAKYIHLSYEIM